MDTKSPPATYHLTWEQSLFDQKLGILLFCLVILFSLATFIRLNRIKAPGVLVEREYTSAIFARTFYFERNESVEAWRKDMARTTKQRQPILEPPVTEYLVSWIYQIVGQEDLNYARFLTSAFWIVGGIFFFQISQALLSSGAALLATGFYLFVPIGVLVSRSFQPDALMMMMLLISLYLMLNYFDRPSISGLILAAIVSGLTLLSRPLVLFAIFGVFIACSIHKKGNWRQVIDRHFLIFSFVCLLLPLAYYGYGIFIAGYLHWKVASSFRPFLFFRYEFWRDWFLLAVHAVGYTALIAALLGAPLLRKGLAQAFVIGLLAGYFVFGLFFTFHIHTHDYYHLQLIPVVAICAAAFAGMVVNQLRNSTFRYWWLSATGVVLIMLFFGYRQVKDGLNAQVFESEKTARNIGKLVNHSDRTVFLAYHYGLPLEYYGELSGTFWPRKITSEFYRRAGERELTVMERLDALGFTPEYFIITNFDDYNTNHQDLQGFLTQNCAVLAETERYLVYQSCVY